MGRGNFGVTSLTLLRHTHTHPLNGPFSGTTRVSRYQKGKTNLDLTEARDREWQWHQLGHMQVCTSLQTDNHASTPPLSFLQAGCPSCHPTNSVKALKASHPVEKYRKYPAELKLFAGWQQRCRQLLSVLQQLQLVVLCKLCLLLY